MRPSYYKPTVAFIVAVVAVVTVYDVWAVSHDYTWTISATLLQAAKAWPIIGVLIGILIGHLFFPNRAAGASGITLQSFHDAFDVAWKAARPTQVIGTDVADALAKELGLQ
jgi:hypothetical protein